MLFRSISLMEQILFFNRHKRLFFFFFFPLILNFGLISTFPNMYWAKFMILILNYLLDFKFYSISLCWCKMCLDL